MQPVPTTAVLFPTSTVIELSPLTSMRGPDPAEKPAVQWPPERTVNGIPLARASVKAIATSGTVLQQTMKQGEGSKTGLMSIRSSS